MQPYHATDDGRWADKVIGASACENDLRVSGRSTRKRQLAFGSDWFVAPPTPLEGIYAAVTRETLDGRHPDGWIPEQKIRSRTPSAPTPRTRPRRSSASAGRAASRAGLLADFVMLDRNLLDIPAADLKRTRVDLTVVGGRIVFER